MVLTDLELTKLCAEAMGLTVVGVYDRPANQAGANLVCYHLPVDIEYDPLNDDVQAMAIVKKYRLKTQPIAPTGWLVHTTESVPAFSGKGKDLNRAIVECVAKMQAAKNAVTT